MDGIKTGYISASGFNLVTSVHRGNRYVIGVVLGGSSAGSRDARMRELISEKIAQASTKRTAPMIAEAGRPIEPKEEKSVAQLESKAEPKRVANAGRKGEAKADTKAEPRFTVASASSVPARLEPTPAFADTPAATAASRTGIVIGSTDPIRPVPVKTLTVRSGTQIAPVAALQVSSPPANETLEGAGGASPPAAAKAEEPAVAAERSAWPSAVRTAAAEPVATSSAKAPEAQSAVAQLLPPPPTSRPPLRGSWVIQVGAYHVEQEAKQRLAAVQSKASKMLTGADAVTETFDKGGTTFYRARFAGLDKDKAEAACKYLKRNDVECVTIKN